MAEIQQHDELISVAQQLATVSAPLMRELNSLRSNSGLDSIQRSLAQTAKVNDSLLASTQGLLKLQSQLSLDKTRIAQIIGANQNLESVISKIGDFKGLAPINLAAQLAPSNLAALSGLSNSFAASYLKLDASRTFAASLAAQQKMMAMYNVPIGRLLNSDTTFRRSASAHLGRMTRSYDALMSAANSSPSLVSHLPTIASYPPIEYYRHVEAIETITVPVEREQHFTEPREESTDRGAAIVDELLKQLDPPLFALLAGARQSAVDNNPERARHTTASLRELVTQVLHALAPDAQIGSWTSASEHFHNGRPTRRARLLFICRDINSGPFAAFVDADVSATVALVGSLNAGTHTVTSQLTPAQLHSMVMRVESLLLFLLRLDRLHGCTS
jgi:hypothetical protein